MKFSNIKKIWAIYQNIFYSYYYLPICITVAPLSVSCQVFCPLPVLDTARGVGVLQDGGHCPPLASVQVLVGVHLLGTASLFYGHRSTT